MKQPLLFIILEYTNLVTVVGIIVHPAIAHPVTFAGHVAAFTVTAAV